MINVYLCEDEPVQLRILKNKIESYIKNTGKNARIISVQTNPEKTLSDAKKNFNSPSLFFIDVELKGYLMNGFSLVQELVGVSSLFGFVFLTSHEELAYKVFDYRLQVLDYIVKKPEIFLKDEFEKEVVDRLEDIFSKMENRKVKTGRQVLFECGSQKVYLPVEDVICVQAQKEKSHYYQVTAVDRQLTVRSTMTQLIEMLQDDFVMVSRSCLISAAHVHVIRTGEREIVMDNGISCPIPRMNMKKVCEEIERKRGEAVC